MYNNARELVPYTFEQCPERTLVYGKNNVEIMLALGLEDKILMTADCSSVLPEYEEAFAELDRVKNHQDVGYFVKEYALSLEPDMVIGWYSLFNIEDRMGDVGFWHERGIGTYTSINSVLKDDQSLQNEYADIRNIAAIYNKQEKAEEIIAEIEADVAKGKQAAAGSEPQRILIAEKYEGEYDIYHAKSCAGDIAAQLGAEPLGEKGWTDEQIVEAVLDKINEAQIWIPDGEIYDYYRRKKPQLQKRLDNEKVIKFKSYVSFYKSIVDQDRASVVICNLKHEIIYMNPAAVTSYAKRGGDKLIGRSLLDCHSPESRDKIQQVVDWFAADESHNIVYTFHNEKQNKDVYMVALRDEGKLIGYYEKHEYRNSETMKPYDLW